MAAAIDQLGRIDTAPRMAPDALESFLAGIPMRRMETGREVAGLALFLAGDHASYATGEIVHPDGGSTPSEDLVQRRGVDWFTMHGRRSPQSSTWRRGTPLRKDTGAK